MQDEQAVLWSIIERVQGAAEGELDASIAAFQAELEALDDATLIGVEAAFSAAMQRAYDHSLWAAAYVIHGGCGDDAFWDFRAGLIALGRDVFDAALEDPDSLAAIDDIEERTLFEGFQYVPKQLLESRGLTGRGGGHSKGDPTGQRWSEDDTEALKQRFPRLAARFDWI